MHLTRRSLITAGASAASASALAGCGLGGPPVQAKKPGIDLTVWFMGTNTVEIDLVTDHIVPAFEATYDVTVEVTFADPSDLSTKLNAAFAGGTAPDVFGHGPAAVADYVAQERIASLDEYVATFPEDEQADLAQAFASGQVDGVQYLIPLSINSQLLAYDGGAFEAAGIDPDDPPTTWQEAREMAQELTTREDGRITRSGLILPTNPPVPIQQSFTSLLYAHGGAMIADDGFTPAFAGPEGVDVLEFLTDLHHGEHAVTGSIGTDYESVPPAQAPLASGDGVMQMQTPQSLHQILEAAPDAELRVAPALSFDTSDRPSGFGGGGDGLMLNADSPDPGLGWEFISYISSKDVNAEYAEGIGALPIRESAKTHEYVAGSDNLTTFLDSVPDLQPNPNVPGWVQARDRISQHLERAVHRQVGAAEALENATADVSSIFGRGR